MGWNANSAATMKLRPMYPVAKSSTQNSTTTSTECHSAFIMWCPAGSMPNIWQSIECEIQVTGCQLLSSKLRIAHLIVGHVRPSCTCRFS